MTILSSYCMRKMLRKIPQGDWLCEECQMKEDVVKRADRREKLSVAVKESKLKEDDDVKKVDASEKVSGIDKERKFKEHTGVKKRDGDESYTGYRASKESKPKVNIENNKLVEKSDYVHRMPKSTCPNESSQSLANASKKFFPKVDTMSVDPSMLRVHRGLTSPRTLAKRLAENQEVSILENKIPPEVIGECNGICSPRKKVALSRENSFKNVDIGKSKAARTLPSNVDLTADNSLGSPRSQSMLGFHLSKVQAQPRPPYGKLQIRLVVNQEIPFLSF